MKSLRTVLSLPFVVLVLAAGTLPACQSESNTPPLDVVTDTNTNWLLPCEDEGVCDGLECRCGVCTEACQSDADCAEFGDAAVCVQAASAECGGQRSCVARTDNLPAGSTVAATGTAPSASSSPPSADASVALGGAASTGSDGAGRTDAGQSSVSTEPSMDMGPVASEPMLGQGASAGSANTTDASTGGGGAGGAGMGSGGAGAVGAGAGGSGSEVTSADAGNEDAGPVVSACETAMDMAPCDVEGQTCGGPCTDECSFCNMTRCSGGIWTQLEVFPAPCFDCGESTRCNLLQTYCNHEAEVFSCQPIPVNCSAEPSCECLESELSGAACTETGEGFNVER